MNWKKKRVVKRMNMEKNEIGTVQELNVKSNCKRYCKRSRREGSCCKGC